jgi:hypothetical protein
MVIMYLHIVALHTLVEHSAGAELHVDRFVMIGKGLRDDEEVIVVEKLGCRSSMVVVLELSKLEASSGRRKRACQAR